MAAKQIFKRNGKAKWILTAVVIVLVLALAAGLCVALVRTDDDDVTTFDVNPGSMKLLTADAVKDCKLLVDADANALGTGEMRLLLLSYDERSKECVFIMGSPYGDVDESGTVDDDESGALFFFRIYDVEESEVVKISNMSTVLSVLREKDCSVFQFDGSMGDEAVWGNYGMVLFNFVVDKNFGAGDCASSAPAAHLQFDAEGTYKPSKRVMNILTGEV